MQLLDFSLNYAFFPLSSRQVALMRLLPSWKACFFILPFLFKTFRSLFLSTLSLFLSSAFQSVPCLAYSEWDWLKIEIKYCPFKKRVSSEQNIASASKFLPMSKKKILSLLQETTVLYQTPSHHSRNPARRRGKFRGGPIRRWKQFDRLWWIALPSENVLRCFRRRRSVCQQSRSREVPTPPFPPSPPSLPLPLAFRIKLCWKFSLSKFG